MSEVLSQNSSTQSSVKWVDMSEEEIRKEMCRIFMEDDDFDIYMREWDKKSDKSVCPKKIFSFEEKKTPDILVV